MKFAKWTFGILIVIGAMAFLRLVTLESYPQNHLFEIADSASGVSGKSITFILGRDKPGQDYFRLAEQHFLWDSLEKTDHIVKSVHTLSGIIHFLNKNKGTRGWSVVNVVLHGNMWSGLSVPMWDEGERAYPKELFRAARSGQFPKLDTGAIDKNSKINFWACGIGKNPLINLAIEEIFTSEIGITPSIYTSPHFVIFKEDRQGTVRRLNASYWPYFYRRGYRPGDLEIANALATQFPEDSVSWQNALQVSSGQSASTFTEQFHIPVSWTVLYENKESRPDVYTEDQKMTWIRAQPELMEKIADLEIPIDKYTWTVHKIIYRHKDGTTQPAIKAIGMSTVLCVLDPLET